MSTARLITGALLHVGGDAPSLIRNATEDAQPERRNKRQGRLQKTLSAFDSLTVSLVTQSVQLNAGPRGRVSASRVCLRSCFIECVCACVFVCEKSPRAVRNLPKSFGSLACKCLCTRCSKIHAFLSSHEFIYCSIVYTYFCLLLFKCYYLTNATLNNMSFNAIQIPQIIS